MQLGIDYVLITLQLAFFVAMFWWIGSHSARTKTARNEQRKLSATGLNNLTVGVTLAAFVIPAFQSVNVADPFTLKQLLYVVAYSPLLVLAVLLHACARNILSKLED